MSDLLYAVPAYRQQVHAGHLIQTAELTKALGTRLAVTWADTCSLDWARNVLIWAGLNKFRSRWLLMTDADTYHWVAADVLRMLDDGERVSAAVIAAPVRVRSAERDLYNPGMVENGKERNLVKDEFLGKVMRVDRMGTAFMAINLQFLKERWNTGPWFQSKQVDRGLEPPGWVGEDYAFSDEIRAHGGSVWLDGRFEPTHSGVVNEIAVMRDFGAAVVQGR